MILFPSGLPCVSSWLLRSDRGPLAPKAAPLVEGLLGGLAAPQPGRMGA